MSTVSSRSTDRSPAAWPSARPREVPSPPRALPRSTATIVPPTQPIKTSQQPSKPATTSDSSSSSSSDSGGDEEDLKHELFVPRKSKLGLVGLTVSIGGAQIVASVQSAWGSTYLFDLGLATQSTALVWLAVPLAAVVVQPIVGALSDDVAGRFRRRGWVLGSAVILATSIVYLANASTFAVEILGLDADDERSKSLTMWIAIAALYVLNASLTGLQSGTKDLALDVAPPSQQVETSSLGNRLSDLSSLLAYLVGALPLERFKAVNWIGGGQFRQLAMLAMGAMVLSVVVTCATQREDPEMQTVDKKRKGLVGRWRELKRNVGRVPREIKRVCYVQFFSWMALFPFLVYSTTYVSNVVLVSVDPPPSSETAARSGSLALFFHALVSLVTSATIPYLTLLSSNAFFAKYLNGPSTLLRRTTARVLLFLSARNFWSIALLAHATLMISTFWIKTGWQAATMVSLMGFTYSIALWAPYALLTEAYLVEQAKAACPACSDSGALSISPTARSDNEIAMNSDSSIDFDHIPFHHPHFPHFGRHRSQRKTTRGQTDEKDRQRHDPECPNDDARPNLDPFETARPFHKPHSLSSRLLDETDFAPDGEDDDGDGGGGGEEAGDTSVKKKRSDLAGLSTTIVTLHNLSMLVPQLVIALLAAVSFKFVNEHVYPADQSSSAFLTKRDTDEIAWLFRCCGALALVGLGIGRTIRETRWEQSVRKRLNVERWI